MWSAIGLPIAIAVGMNSFRDLLAGAHAMDRHFLETPLERNVPVLMGLIGLWYNDFWNAESVAVLPYDHRMRWLPSYLQQAEMESNGKTVTRDGATVDYKTAPIVWGAEGTNAQHTFFQLLHQGSRMIPADFIATITPDHGLAEQHDILLSNFLAQTAALLSGRTEDAAKQDLAARGMPEDSLRQLSAHLACGGNRPSTSILLPQLDAFHFGALIALYEHKIFTQGVIWRLNPFDQWGVELGKALARAVRPALDLDADNKAARAFDPSTRALIDFIRATRKKKGG